MTLHWWMHWFWITVTIPAVVFMFLSVSVSHCAPLASPVPELMLPMELLSTGGPESSPHFHHDSSSFFIASVSPSTFTSDDTDDTPSDLSAIFPLQGSTNPAGVVVLQEHYSPSEELTPEVTLTHAEPSQTTLLETYDNPMNKEVLTTSTDNEQSDDDGQTKLFARDISLASRSGKAIGRDFISSTPIPQVALGTSSSSSAQLSNHNPFINSEDVNKNESDKKLSSTDEKEEVVEQHAGDGDESNIAAATSPKEQEVVVASTIAATPNLHENSDMQSSPEEHALNESPSSSLPVLPTHSPPAWVSSSVSEEESAEEEAETEENAGLNSSILEEQPTELVDNDISSEAVTKGRMPAEQGLDAPSIIGIVLGLIGLICLVGGTSGFVWYRRRFLNKPQTLNDKCSNADSSGYIDDTLRVSAGCMNKTAGVSAAGRARAPAEARNVGTLTLNKDNSEEMYSLDNDSFLNSLEAMTIQNYWTDSVKHTKL